MKQTTAQVVRAVVLAIFPALPFTVGLRPAAAFVMWTQSGTGDWLDSGNWDSGVPGAADLAIIDQGTAQVLTASTPTVNEIYLSMNANSTLELINGTLDVTTGLHCGLFASSQVKIQGQSTLTADSLGLALGSTTSSGTLEISDGVIDLANTITVGTGGSGTITQTGGAISSHLGVMGSIGGSHGTWNMTGGTLDVGSTFIVGLDGVGEFNQGGTSSVTLADLYLTPNGWGSPLGKYTLSGGTLTANNIYRGQSNGVFEMAGGRLVVTEFGDSNFTSLPLIVDDGTVAPGDTSVGTTSLAGDYHQSSAGTLELDLNGTLSGEFDALIVEGEVTINSGQITIVLGYPPQFGDTFLVVDNADVDPIVGTFAGILEGGTVSATYNNQTFHFEVTYVGGTGNDVVLTAVEFTCTPPPVDMRAWWTFDEDAGTVAAELVNGNDGDHVNGPVPLIGEVVDNALCFDGATSYVEVPDAPALNFGTGDFTIDAWIRTTDAFFGILVEKREDPGDGVIGYSLYLRNGRLGLQIADGSGANNCGCNDSAACTNFEGSVFVADGDWHLVAVTVDRSVAFGGTFYVDGIAVDVFDPMCRPGSISNSGPLRIGRSSVFFPAFYEGCIDEVELFDRALGEEEIVDIYNAGSVGKCKCLCPGDVNQDGFVNGLDIAPFNRCVLGNPQVGDYCPCADLDGNELFNQNDIDLFTQALSNSGPCP